MFARATSGDKKNNNKFSPCSLNSINPVLNSKARSQMGCFTGIIYVALPVSYKLQVNLALNPIFVFQLFCLISLFYAEEVKFIFPTGFKSKRIFDVIKISALIGRRLLFHVISAPSHIA